MPVREEQKPEQFRILGRLREGIYSGICCCCLQYTPYDSHFHRAAMTPVAPPLSSPCANWSLLPFDLIPGLSWPPTVVPLSNLSIFRLFSKFSLAEASAERLDAPLQADLEKPHEETASPGSEIRKRDEAPSPIHSIPPEIVSLIFEFTLPPFVPSYGLASVQNGPWVLSAVCSRWRYIALSQPSLWKTVFLEFTDEDWDAPSFELIQPKLAAYLARSKQLPLNITFRAFWHEALCVKR
ncbi:hypothetical protein B0H13DRAFT_2199196, partial [Mycena leptocephala]